jgi:hypothetical protein
MTGVYMIPPGGGIFEVHATEEEIAELAGINSSWNYFFPLDVLRRSLIHVGHALDQANANRDSAMLDLVAVVKKARDDGLSITEIHRLTGLSRQSLHKIIRKLNAAHCSNPACPEAGRCGGECARNF